MPFLRSLPTLLTIVLVLGCGGGSSPTEPTPTAPAPPPPPAVTSQVLRTATFQGLSGHNARGTATVVQRGESFTLELADDFRTDEGSFVEIRLCRSGTTCNDTDLNLGPIKARRGAQSYTLPDAATALSHVVVWCVPFRVPFGSGELR